MTASSGMLTYKIVVDGPWSSGKTEFIKTISEIDIVSTQTGRNTTTVAMDFGRITVDETLVLYLFATPGARRFDFGQSLLLAEGFLGTIVMIDSRRPETFREARYIAQRHAQSSTCPYVFAANFQDHPDAWDV